MPGAPESIDGLQTRLLKETVEYALANSPFYSKRFKGLGITPSSIRSLSDIEGLPITTKEDLQRENWSFLCVDKGRASEIVATTGTTGSIVYMALTGRDLERLAENERRSFAEMGLKGGDLVQIAVTLDNLFIAGLAYYAGLKGLGASVLRTGPQNPRRQLELLDRLSARAIVAVPSFLLHMKREADAAGISLKGLALEKALLIGESIRSGDFSSNGLGQRVEEAWPVETFSTYGITEASVAFYECASHRGLHAHPDFVYAEILDDAGKSAAPGEPGELTVTTFQVEAMPLVRYRTGDITFMPEGPCECGKAGQRLGPVIGRKAQRLKYKGTTVYPGAIENALMELGEVVNFQIVAYSGDEGSDRIVVRAGARSPGGALVDRIKDAIRSSARVAPEVELMDPERVEALLFEGNRRKKASFLDLRAAGC